MARYRALVTIFCFVALFLVSAAAMSQCTGGGGDGGDGDPTTTTVPPTTTTDAPTTTTTMGPHTSLLALPQGNAFAILGHSCGGIQEQSYATGFDAVTGDPVGDVYMQTRCGGSGRGGGYHSTTYSAWAAVTWDFNGGVVAQTKLASAPSGLDPAFSATDANGNTVYNTGTPPSVHAYVTVP